MNCAHCGASNLDTSSICVNCGRPLNAAPPPPPPAPPPQSYTPSQSYTPPPPPRASYPGGPPPQGTLPNYLFLAIFTTLCCCLPLGIVAIIFGAQVNSKLAAGDYAGAAAASANAKKFALIGIFVGLAINLLWFFFYGATSFMEGFRDAMGN